MDNKETIIQTTIALIEEKGEDLDKITVREISKKAGVGLGLVNYHFGNKDNLLHSSECLKYGIFKRFVSYLLLTHKYSYGLISSYPVHLRYDLYLSKQS